MKKIIKVVLGTYSLLCIVLQSVIVGYTCNYYPLDNSSIRQNTIGIFIINTGNI